MEESMKEKTNEEIREEIENALLILQDFYDADEEDQEEALEVATKCMKYALNVLGA